MRYLNSVLSRKKTPQSQPIPGSHQIPNSAGGFAWAVDDWVRLDRFLILGSEGGSYYATEKALTRENAEAVARCVAADGVRVVRRVVEISVAGRAPKNDPTIFALALCAGIGDAPTRRAALDAVSSVCRIGTHLFHFAEYVDGFRGWGRGLRTAMAGWYNALPADKLAYQMVKYQSRDKWSHRDLLRLSHPAPVDETHKILYHWATQGWADVGDSPHPVSELSLVWAFERAKRAESVKEIVGLIRNYQLPREAIPTQWLTEVTVWEALLEKMPLTALIRNLATMTRVGLLVSGSEAVKKVQKRLSDRDQLMRARIHPIAVLAALKTYEAGRGMRGQSTWTPVAKIVDSLDDAFYSSFGNVVPTQKRWLMALDVSGSMGAGAVAGVPGLTPRVASVAMALVTAAVESDHQFVAFTAGTLPSMHRGYSTGITELSISPRQRLDDVIRKTDNLPFGGTDCALPMIWATQKRAKVDVFVVLTDSETWAGNVHPVQALNEYRQVMGIPAKLIVVGMVSNNFTIADPNDAGMMDVVGFDTATPQLMADFVR